jgi:hypothetical protein
MLLKRKEILSILFFTSIICLITYVFALTGNLNYYYYIILPVILYLFSINKEFVIVLYLLLLPTAGIIPSEENILEAFGLDEFINIITIGYFINSKFFSNKINKIQQSAKSLVIFMILIVFFVNLKNAFFGIYDGEYFLAFKRVIFIIIKYLPLFFIIKYINKFKIRQYVILGIYISGVLIVLSQFFNEHLLLINFVTFDDSEFAGLAARVEKINRFSGFYNGDPNSAGIFLLMVIGYLFIQIEKQKKKVLLLLVLLFSGGILLTASRTVIVSFVVIALIFSYYNKSSKISFQIYLLFAIAGLFAFDFIANQLSRFHNAHLQTSTKVDGNRIMKWVYYLNFMLESPEYFITGAQEEINNRSAHNVYVQMLFNVGIFPVIIFITKLIKSFTLIIKHNKKSIYFVIPFFSITMYVGELKEVPIYILLFMLVMSESTKQNISSNKQINI